MIISTWWVFEVNSPAFYDITILLLDLEKKDTLDLLDNLLETIFLLLKLLDIFEDFFAF